MLILLALGAAAAVASAWILERVRDHALSTARLDVPNPRSSHVVPTPRGGGIGFVLPVLVFLGAAALSGRLGPVVAALILAALAAVAAAGWADDRGDLVIAIRLAVHLAAGLALAWAAFRLGAGGSLPATVAAVWWILWTVSAINVVNFMDGIDGLIAVQALVYTAFAAFALAPPALAAEGEARTWMALAVVAAGAVLAFARRNWPPAAIFMGDVGSGFLGALFVVLGMATLAGREWTVVHAFLPLAPLFVDGGLTLTRRLSRRERLWVAHRSHVYQRMVQAGWPHARVTLLYGLLSLAGAAIVLLLPWPVARFLLVALWYLVVTTMALVLLGHRSDRRLAAEA